MSGTENAINELSSVGNRYRDGWGLMASARAERPPSSSRRGSGLGKQHYKRACKAYVMCCEPVIMVEDVSGAVSLDHCTVVAGHAVA
ncbi:hypothetical protein PSYTB_07965 [Pseudomonas amygdali pv. tabaci str. ATCC 11528]|nr:hypothetical protein PSYTB_07965 [Pseudomonas amygdali pv. tabaci str. ATCC 11528]